MRGGVHAHGAAAPCTRSGWSKGGMAQQRVQRVAKYGGSNGLSVGTAPKSKGRKSVVKKGEMRKKKGPEAKMIFHHHSISYSFGKYYFN